MDFMNNTPFEKAGIETLSNISLSVLSAGIVSITGIGPAVMIPALLGTLGLNWVKKIMQSNHETSEENIRNLLQVMWKNNRYSQKHIKEDLQAFCHKYQLNATKYEEAIENSAAKIRQLLLIMNSIQNTLNSIEGQNVDIQERIDKIENRLKKNGFEAEIAIFQKGIYNYLDINFLEIRESLTDFVSSEEIERLTELLDKRPRLSIQERIFDKNSFNLFLYKYRLVDCVGREKAFNELWNFINNEEKFLWWAIIGKGGIGKTRLAMELCIQLREKGWYAGFLMDGSQSFMDWRPTRPTCIIVDYQCDQHLEHIGKNFSLLYQNHLKEPFEHPIRLIILQRLLTTEWFERFTRCSREDLKYRIAYENNREQALTLQQEDRFSSKSLKDRVVPFDPLKLQDIDKQSYLTIGYQVFDFCNKLFDKRKLFSDQYKKSYLHTLYKNPEYSRPLYAAFIAYALYQSKVARIWDIDQLHEEVLKHTENIWEYNCIDQQHRNLLFFATICGGLDIPEEETPEEQVSKIAEDFNDNIFPSQRGMIHSFSREHYQILSDNPVENKLYPLEPDILGEYFIFNSLSDPQKKTLYGYLIQKAWEIFPENTGYFFARMISDFNAIYQEDLFFMIQPTTDVMDERIRWWIVALSFCSNVFSSKGDIASAEKCYENIKKIREKGSVFANALGVARSQSLTAFNLVGGLGDKGNLHMAAKYYKEIKSLREENRVFYYDDQIAIEQTKAALNLIYDYLDNDNGNIIKAEDYYNEIYTLRKERFANNTLLATFHAQAAVKFTRFLGENNIYPEKAIRYNEAIKTLRQDFASNLELVLHQVEALVNLTAHLGNIGELEEAVGYYEEIKSLRQEKVEFTQDLEITLNQAKAAVNLTAFLKNKGNIQKAENYYKDIKALRQERADFALDLEIGLRQVEAAINLIGDFLDKGELRKAVVYYKAIRELREINDAFACDRQFALLYVKTGVLFICQLGTKGDLQEAVSYYNDIKALRQEREDFAQDLEIGLCQVEAAINLIGDFLDKGELRKAVVYYNEIKDLRETNAKFTGDIQFALHHANAAFILSTKSGEIGDFHKAVEYFNAIKEIRKEQKAFAYNPQIAMELAEAAVNLTFFFVIKGNYDNAIIYYKAIESLREEHDSFMANPYIAKKQAQAAVNLLNFFLNKGQLNPAVEYYEAIITLRKERDIFTIEPQIALEQAKAAFNLQNLLCRIGNLDNAVIYFKTIEALRKEHDSFITNSQLAIKQAEAAVNLISFFGINREIETAKVYFEELKKLRKEHESFSRDSDIALLQAKAVFNLICIFRETGNIKRAVKHYEMIKTLRKEQESFFIDPQIVREQVEAAFGLAEFYFCKKMYKDSHAYITEIESLFELMSNQKCSIEEMSCFPFQIKCAYYAKINEISVDQVLQSIQSGDLKKVDILSKWEELGKES